MTPSTPDVRRSAPERQSRLRRGLRRVAVGAPATLIALAAAGAAYQAAGEARDRRTMQPPGRLVDVGSARLHLDCRGSGSPTVVLEAGAMGFAATWGWVQPEVARTTRVCAYDRAGMGWSSASSAPRSATTVARELRAALDAAGERGPYVLVGHSLGSVFAEVFAATYPAEVAGLVLVDPAHHDQTERFAPGTVEEWRDFIRMIGAMPTLAQLGLLRTTDMLTAMAEGLPSDAVREARLFASSPRHLRASNAEYDAWYTIMDDTRRVLAGNAEKDQPPFGDRPLAVLSATRWPDDAHGALAVNHQMHEETSRLSTRGRHELVDGADHMSLLMRREHSERTVAEISRVVREARGAGAPPMAVAHHAVATEPDV